MTDTTSISTESDMTKTTHTIWVCGDCMFHEANGECGNCDEVTGHHDRPPLGLLEGQEISLGMTREEHATNCPSYGEGGDENADCGCELQEFSWSQCEGCGTRLGGDRHAMTVWTEA